MDDYLQDVADIARHYMICGGLDRDKAIDEAFIIVPLPCRFECCDPSPEDVIAVRQYLRSRTV
jgi:hypothetical protein